MPCGSRRNYEEDKKTPKLLQNSLELNTVVDLTQVRSTFLDAVVGATTVNDTALVNIAPRLRMTTLYTVAASENRLGGYGKPK